MKILAVDDDFSILELLPMILAEAGFKDVTVASSAQDAIGLIANQSEPFECFLLDIQMPGGSGIELCRAIRELPDYGKTPVIMLTALLERSFINASFAAGATDYATKPLDITELCARVRTATLLSAEQRKVKKFSRVFGNTDKGFLDKSGSNFGKVINLSGVNGLISKQALENYMEQLSRAELESATCFAVHIKGCRNVFEKAAPFEFEYALQHISETILASPMLESVIMYYAGSGNFVCYSNIAILTAADLLEAEVQYGLNDKDFTFDEGLPIDVEIAVGAAVKPLLGQPLQFDVLASQAVKLAMVRVEEKRSASENENVRRIPLGRA